MTTTTWITWGAVQLVLVIINTVAVGLYDYEARLGCDSGYLCGLPIEQEVDAAVVGWNNVTYNPLTIVSALWTSARSFVVGLWGLLIFDYAFLMGGEGWANTPRRLLQAVSFVGGATIGWEIVTRMVR